MTIEGKHYRVQDAINSPAPIQAGGPPILIGGQGERKTLRLMAEHAEMANINANFDEYPRKLEVLAQHCADVGRDPATINKTPLAFLVLGATMEDAAAKRNGLLAERGLPPWDQLDEGMQAMLGGRMLFGDPDAVGEQMRTLLEVGLDGIVLNMPTDGWDLDAVRLAGQVVSAAVN